MKNSRNIAILCNEYTALFELGCAVELFALDRPDIKNWYKTDVISLVDDPVKTTAGLQLGVKQVNSLARYGTLIIPNWYTKGEELPARVRKMLLAFHKSGNRIYSFCTGAFMLAELGLLDGREATTHWQYADEFKQRYPTVKYVDDVLYVYGDTIGTSAGSAAAIDLGLEIIRRDFGYKTANMVARRLVLAAHRAGSQSQFVETAVLNKPGKFSTSVDWALKNLSDNINVDMLADRATMSRRTYDRKFRATFNLSPKEWLIQQRLELAKQRLEESNDSIEHVAASAGFEGAANLRHHFRKQLHLSPRKYREYFGELRRSG